MIKNFLLLICAYFFTSNLYAQKFPVYIAPSLHHALGEFNSTHGWGIGIECGSAKNWYDPGKINKIFFTWKGGYTYLFSKKITTGSFPDLYFGYSFIHAFPGMQFNHVKKTSIRLFAGPGLGIYSSNTRFIIGTELDATYLIKTNLAVGPAIVMMKESGADAIWALGVKVIIKIN